MITILSPNAAYRATVSDRDDGPFVTIHRASNGRRNPGGQIWHGTLDAPFHVALDRVADVLAELEDES